ncbi:hypothetical protein MIND_00487800 [Mycena indigotica]|uniref:Uncharacterized protein n=1 Tax=Mycena indigotica TaxID=2126181 RepID=A0A8H6SVH8_9AGAR|nr:uncharacterized protein MIND_00487800 [Mycena indigotica]KAF7306950.1 hypothetical protein MIND_00487800 [Mycena indigotica]
MASPLEPSTVAILLHYIIPSIQTIPPHLLAKALAFRHSCLDLTAQDGPPYLAWPSDDDKRVAEALIALQSTRLDNRCSFNIRYTADDAQLAHVEVSPTLRLVFRHEGDWKFNNVALMPFPGGAFDSPVELRVLEETEDTPDSYWDSYGEEAEERRETFQEEQGESDYWAQYDRYGGTADSLIPSPAPEKEVPIAFSYAEMHPATDPITESLSDRLEIVLAGRVDEEDSATVVSSENDGLKETIRGVWRLWRASRTSTPVELDQELFRRVIDEIFVEE